MRHLLGTVERRWLTELPPEEQRLLFPDRFESRERSFILTRDRIANAPPRTLIYTFDRWRGLLRRPDRVRIHCELEVHSSGSRVVLRTAPHYFELALIPATAICLALAASPAVGLLALVWLGTAVFFLTRVTHSTALQDVARAFGLRPAVPVYDTGPPCPHCCLPLVSERSRQCLNCHADWHNEDAGSTGR